MEELCINCYDTMTIGEIVVGEVLGPDNKYVRVSLRCVAEIDKGTYLDFVTKKDLLHKVRRSVNNPELKFYRVEILD